ncbi:MAG: hypothetical protein H6754_08940 [Candidatus Omnitrophica bacterium]|nr:hypothetical protein [Candidatus Omnitrophota bacterium]
MNIPTLNKPLQIVSIDTDIMTLSDGSQLQFMPKFPPPKTWQKDDVVELEELKMKMYRITNRSQHQTQAQAYCIKGAQAPGSESINKSMGSEYPQTHLNVEWSIEELLSNTSKMLLSDNSLWELSAAFNAPSRSNAPWSEGQIIEISPLSRIASSGRSKIQAYSILNKDINLTVTGVFLGFRQ